MGTAIRKRLQELGKTQVWLAAELDVSNNAITKWIKTGKISRENSVAASRVLGMSVEELLGEGQIGGSAKDAEPVDEALKRATDMLEVYRLAGAAGRLRIDSVVEQVRDELIAVDKAQSSTS